ncbi:MAG: type 1 glutamine amidotransferase [Jatrophihabitans sp.]
MTLPVLVVQNSTIDPPARLGEWLTSAGLTLDVREMFAGDSLPTDLTGHSGLLVMGGQMGALEDDRAPWLPEVRALLQEAVRAEVPTLGVCLGAQLIAVSLGGRVQVGADGPEIGAQLIAKRAVSATDPLFGPMPITPDVIQWHDDVVTKLPGNAVLLASSPVYEMQAFRVGRVCWAVQAHIETTPEMVRAWAASDQDRPGIDFDRVLERSDAVHDDIAETWQPFAERFAEVVKDPAAVKVGRGPTVTTAAPIDDPAAIRAALAMDMQSSRGHGVLPLPGLRPSDIPDAD